MRTVYVIEKTNGRQGCHWGLGYRTQAEAEAKADELRADAENAGWEITVSRREVER